MKSINIFFKKRWTIYKNNHSPKKIKFFIILIVGYSFLWLCVNNSFDINRDEMWYTSYSTAFNDNSTKDIRYIYNRDFNQIAFLPAFRYFQGFFVNLFGKNIYSLRAINLFFSLIALGITFWTMFRYEVKAIYFFVFMLIISFERQIIEFSHSSRPDFSVAMLALISLASVLHYLKRKRVFFLYVSGFSAVLASSFYWNGLAVLVAFGLTVLFLLFSMELSLTNFKGILFALIPSFFFLFLLPVFLNYELLQEYFSSETFSENHGEIYWYNLGIMFHNSFFKGGGYQALLFLTFLFLFFIIYSAYRKTNNMMVKVWMIFIFTILGVLSLRSNGERHMYMFLPLFYFGMLFFENGAVNFLRSRVNLFKFFLVGLVIIYTCLGIVRAYKNFGQSKAYNSYAKEVNEFISDDGYVLSRYTSAWAIENPKFYLSNFVHSKVYNQNEFDEIINKYNIKYILVDETTRDRINKNDSLFLWHSYLRNSLEKHFTLGKVFYNEFYLQNKLKVPVHKNGYKTEIWVKNDL